MKTQFYVQNTKEEWKQKQWWRDHNPKEVGSDLPQVGIKMETEVGFEMYSDDNSVSLQCRRPRFNPWVGKMPWRKKWQPALVLLLGKSHGQRSLVGYCPRGRKASDMTEWLHFHFGGKVDRICWQQGRNQGYFLGFWLKHVDDDSTIYWDR